MKRKTAQSSIETHDTSSRQFPMPGTDLGTTNAIPFNEAIDVDASGGYGPDYCLGKGDDCSNFSYLDRNRSKDVIPDENPTRMKRKLPSWMENTPAAPSKGKR